MTVKDVYFSYLCATFKATLFLVLGVTTAYFVNNYIPASQFFINTIGCFGLVCDAIALYGFLGWEVQTWDGESPQEKLNTLLSNLIISIGLFLGILAYLLEAV